MAILKISRINLGWRSQKNISIGKFRVLSLTRDEWETIQLFGRYPLFRYHWHKKEAKKNDKLMIRNRIIAQKYAKSSGKRILFVTGTLQSSGGIETRLSYLCKWLRKNGWNPALLVESNNCNHLNEYPIFHINQKAWNAINYFDEIIDIADPIIIEFQCGGIHFLVDALSSRSYQNKIFGVSIHSLTNLTNAIVKNFDYSLCTTERFRSKLQNSVKIIPNWINYPYTQIWYPPKHEENRKALIISRLSHEKKEPIINFIKFCFDNGIEFEIAGDIKQPSAKLVLEALKSIGVPENKLIGLIDTKTFLKKHANDYLFVSGIGQVPIEAAIFGIPVMLPAYGEASFNTFITNSNIYYWREQNFVIRGEPNPKYGCNTDIFLKNLKSRNFKIYMVGKTMELLCSEDKVLGQYLCMLNSTILNHA